MAKRAALKATSRFGGSKQANDVQPVKEETCLRFYLSSEKDFQFFHEAVTGSLQSKK